MKKSPHGIHNAMLFEHLRTFGTDRPRSDGATYMPGNRLYAIDGMPGVWRRIRRGATGIKKSHPGSVLAHFDGAVIELVRDRDIDVELIAAGLQFPPAPIMPETSAIPHPDDPPPEPPDSPDEEEEGDGDEGGSNDVEPDELGEPVAQVPPPNGVAGSHGTPPATPSAPQKSGPISLPNSTKPTTAPPVSTTTKKRPEKVGKS